MKKKELYHALNRALAMRDPGLFAMLYRGNHAADIGAALAEFDIGQVVVLLNRQTPEICAALFGYLDPELQMALVVSLDRSRLAGLFDSMRHDERADLYKRLTLQQRDVFLPALAQAEREDIHRLASYPESTTGAVMTSDYAVLLPQWSAAVAVEHLRSIAPDTETIYQSYVIDAERRLLGVVSLRDLIVAEPLKRIDSFMQRDPTTVQADAPREEASRLIAHYDIVALPVLNAQQQLVGIVTYDDAMDVAEDVATRDFSKSAAVSRLGVGLKNAGINLLYRKRVFWLVLLVFGNLFSGAGMAFYEEVIAANIALVFFLPLLIDSGGNAGSQSATLMVRALGTGDVRPSDWTGMLAREFAVAGLLGATMSAAVALLGYWRGGWEIALVVAITMQLVVVAGSVIGMLLPFLLSRFKLDPAAASAPLITSIADFAGVMIYFAVAAAVLR